MRLRSARISAAVWQRISRSFSRALLMVSSSFGGSSGLRRMAAVGVRFRMASVTTAEVSPRKGRTPVAISYSTTPKENKIGAAVEFLAAQLLGRHVGHGADCGSGTGQVEVGGVGDGLRIAAGGAGGAGNFCQAEVENLGVAAVGHENIGGLDVAVNDAFGVRGVEGVGHFDRKREQALQFHWLAVDEVLQRLAGEAFHHDEEMAVMLADFVDGADVGMVQRRCGAGFAAETLEGLRVLRGNRREEISGPRSGRGECLRLCKPRPFRRRQGVR